MSKALLDRLAAVNYVGNVPVARRGPLDAATWVVDDARIRAQYDRAPGTPGSRGSLALLPGQSVPAEGSVELLEERQERARLMRDQRDTWLAHTDRNVLDEHLLQQLLRAASSNILECNLLVFGQMVKGTEGPRARSHPTMQLRGRAAREPLLAASKSSSGAVDRAVEYISRSIHKEKLVDSPSPLRRQLIAFSMSAIWQWLVVLCVLAHLVLVRWEPPTRHEGSGPMAFELVLVCVYVLDVGFRGLREGHERLLSKPRSVVDMAVIFLIMCDVMLSLAVGGTPRFSRPLRPVLIMVRSKRQRKIAATLATSLTSLVDLAGVFVTLILFYAILGIFLFHDKYPDGEKDPFSSVGRAVISLFILLTRDNYAELVHPMYQISPFLSLYFVSFTLIGTYLLMSILLATILDVYKVWRSAKVMNDFVTERRSLVAAFHILDPDGTGKVSFKTCVQLLVKLVPDLAIADIGILFAKLDKDRDNRIGMLEFFELADVLFLRGARKREAGVVSRLSLAAAARILPTQSPLSSSISEIINLPIVRMIHTTVLWSSLVMFLSMTGRSGDASSVVVGAVDAVLMVLVLVFFVLRVLASANPLAFFARNTWNRFDAIVIAISLSGWIASLALAGLDPKLNSDFDVRVARAVSALRCVLVVTNFSRFRRFLSTLEEVGGLLVHVAFFLVLVGYSYAIVGMELFSHVDRDPNSPVLTFDSIGRAMTTLFQVLVTVDWSEHMEFLMEQTTDLAAVYFVSFVVLVVFVGVNLFVALIVETFVSQRQLESAERDYFLENLGVGTSAESSQGGDAGASQRGPREETELAVLGTGASTHTLAAWINVYKDFMDHEEQVIRCQARGRGFLVRRRLARERRERAVRLFAAVAMAAVGFARFRKRMAENHARAAATRARIIVEIVDTERSFLDAIATALSKRKAIQQLAGDHVAFGNLAEILAYNRGAVLEPLEGSGGEPVETDEVAKVFGRFDAAKVYTAYVNGYDDAAHRLAEVDKELRDDDEVARTLVRELQSVLIMPVQRIPRYVLLLRELAKNSPRGSALQGAVEKAQAHVSQQADIVNEAKRRQEELEKISSLEKTLVGYSGPSLAVGARVLKSEGALVDVSSGDEILVWVFLLAPDLLIVTKRAVRKSVSYKFIEAISLKDLPDGVVGDASDILPNAFTVRDHTFVCKTQEEMARWLAWLAV